MKYKKLTFSDTTVYEQKKISNYKEAVQQLNKIIMKAFMKKKRIQTILMRKASHMPKANYLLVSYYVIVI